MSSKPNAETTISKIKDVLSEEKYGYATAVVTYCEAKSLTYIYSGMAEFRDALTHIQRALNADDEKILLEETSSAFEHIRRAAVESMQEYIESRYDEFNKRISLRYKIVLLGKSINWSQIKKGDDKIKECLFCGRQAKSKRSWQESIDFFTDAESELDKLDVIIPTLKEIEYKSSQNLIYILFIFVILLAGIQLISSFPWGR